MSAIPGDHAKVVRPPRGLRYFKCLNGNCCHRIPLTAYVVAHQGEILLTRCEKCNWQYGTQHGEVWLEEKAKKT